MSVAGLQSPDFQHILRILNTNVEGKRKVNFALTAIRGIGRQFGTIVCKKADIDTSRRAGEITNEEVEKINAIIANPQKFKVPVWYLNRQRDFKDGQDRHVVANNVDIALRDDMERLKKIRCNRGLRHFWGFRVRGQHTKTTGRYGLAAHLSKMKK